LQGFEVAQTIETILW